MLPTDLVAVGMARKKNGMRYGAHWSNIWILSWDFARTYFSRTASESIWYVGFRGSCSMKSRTMALRECPPFHGTLVLVKDLQTWGGDSEQMQIQQKVRFISIWLRTALSAADYLTFTLHNPHIAHHESSGTKLAARHRAWHQSQDLGHMLHLNSLDCNHMWELPNFTEQNSTPLTPPVNEFGWAPATSATCQQVHFQGSHHGILSTQRREARAATLSLVNDLKP